MHPPDFVDDFGDEDVRLFAPIKLNLEVVLEKLSAEVNREKGGPNQIVVIRSSLHNVGLRTMTYLIDLACWCFWYFLRPRKYCLTFGAFLSSILANQLT